MHELKCTLFNSADIMHESNLFQGNTSKKLSKLSSWYHIPMPGLSYAHSQSNDIICIIHEEHFISENAFLRISQPGKNNQESLGHLGLWKCMHAQSVDK